MATIGFIGLGNMGAPIAANLIGAGHRVTGFDLVPRAMEALATKGGHAAASAAEAAAAGDIVITMLPAGPQVRSVYLDKGGATGGGRDRDGHPARRGRRQSLPNIRRWRRRRSRFFRDYRLIGKSDHNM
jgi:hypothetical protein